MPSVAFFSSPRRGRHTAGPALQQFGAAAKREGGLGQGTVQRADAPAVVGGDGQVQRVAAAQARGVLIGKPRGGAKVQARHGPNQQRVVDQLRKYGQGLGAVVRRQLAGAYFYRQGAGELGDDPVTDGRFSGSCAASQV